MNERTALQEKVENIERNAEEIKSDVKRIDGSLTEHRVETQKSFGAVNKSISDLRGEVHKSISDLRGDVYKSISDLRGEVSQSISDLRSEVNKAIADLRDEMKSLMGALRGEIRDVMDKSHQDRTTRILSIIAIIIAAVSAGAAVFKALPVPPP